MGQSNGLLLRDIAKLLIELAHYTAHPELYTLTEKEDTERNAIQLYDRIKHSYPSGTL